MIIIINQENKEERNKGRSETLPVVKRELAFFLLLLLLSFVGRISDQSGTATSATSATSTSTQEEEEEEEEEGEKKILFLFKHIHSGKIFQSVKGSSYPPPTTHHPLRPYLNIFKM